MRRSLLMLASCVALASCAGSEMTMIGARRPVRPPGCPVEIVPGTPTPLPASIASVRAYCATSLGRDQCFEELRNVACNLGGDTVYGLSESVAGGENYITATVAWRGESAAGAGGSSAGAACTPICSPGFDCQGGRCIPLCNPACGPAEICNAHRTCAPAPAAGSSAPAPAGG